MNPSEGLNGTVISRGGRLNNTPCYGRVGCFRANVTALYTNDSFLTPEPSISNAHGQKRKNVWK